MFNCCVPLPTYPAVAIPWGKACTALFRLDISVRREVGLACANISRWLVCLCRRLADVLCNFLFCTLCFLCTSAALKPPGEPVCCCGCRIGFPTRLRWGQGVVQRVPPLGLQHTNIKAGSLLRG